MHPDDLVAGHTENAASRRQLIRPGGYPPGSCCRIPCGNQLHASRPRASQGKSVDLEATHALSAERRESRFSTGCLTAQSMVQEPPHLVGPGRRRLYYNLHYLLVASVTLGRQRFSIVFVIIRC